MSSILAQCVMCYRTAAAQQTARSQVLNTGIAILLIPPLLIIGIILILAWKRNRHVSAGTGLPEQPSIRTDCD